jgi:hypothetical protein
METIGCDTAAGERDAVLTRYEHHLSIEETSWAERSLLLATARRFLDWFSAEEDMPRLPELAWDAREAFLIDACPDRDARHDLRAQVNRFLLSLGAG